MTADCYLKLGEIGLEKEDFVQALEDLQNCQIILQKWCAPNDRRLAEVNYQMALGKMQQNDYEGAIKELNQCVDSLNLQLNALNNGEATDTDSQKRLQDLIVDVTSMIGECKEEQLDIEVAKKRFKSLLGGFSEGSFSNNGDSESQPKDITHLIRKRKKDDEQPIIQSEDLPVSKKLKVNGNDTPLETVNGINGNQTDVLHENGHVDN